MLNGATNQGITINPPTHGNSTMDNRDASTPSPNLEPCKYKTRSGATFTCKPEDIEKVEQLYCQCPVSDGNGSHIMEGKGKRTGNLFKQVEEAPDDIKNYIVQTVDGKCMDRLCAIEQNEKSNEVSIDYRLNLLCGNIQVSCTKEKEEGSTCGKMLSLSQFPDHWHEECSVASPFACDWKAPLRVDIDSSTVGLKKELSELKSKFAELYDKLVALEKQQTRDSAQIHALNKQLQLANLDLKLQIEHSSDRNGELVWKLRDVAKLRKQAQTGETLSLYSAPFYTSDCGYKMCLIVFLNGDGMGKNTHCSLFFTIMKGEYDALLSWPFKQRVIMKLLDQSNTDKRKDITVSFMPDDSINYTKPQEGSKMNIASGFPNFVEQNVFENERYVKDNTMYFYAQVDTSNLKKPGQA